MHSMLRSFARQRLSKGGNGDAEKAVLTSCFRSSPASEWVAVGLIGFRRVPINVGLQLGRVTIADQLNSIHSLIIPEIQVLSCTRPSNMPHIILLGTLDTKRDEVIYLRDQLQQISARLSTPLEITLIDCGRQAHP